MRFWGRAAWVMDRRFQGNNYLSAPRDGPVEPSWEPITASTWWMVQSGKDVVRRCFKRTSSRGFTTKWPPGHTGKLQDSTWAGVFSRYNARFLSSSILSIKHQAWRKSMLCNAPIYWKYQQYRWKLYSMFYTYHCVHTTAIHHRATQF